MEVFQAVFSNTTRSIVHLKAQTYAKLVSLAVKDPTNSLPLNDMYNHCNEIYTKQLLF